MNDESFNNDEDEIIDLFYEILKHKDGLNYIETLFNDIFPEYISKTLFKCLKESQCFRNSENKSEEDIILFKKRLVSLYDELSDSVLDAYNSGKENIDRVSYICANAQKAKDLIS